MEFREPPVLSMLAPARTAVPAVPDVPDVPAVPASLVFCLTYRPSLLYLHSRAPSRPQYVSVFASMKPSLCKRRVCLQRQKSRAALRSLPVCPESKFRRYKRRRLEPERGGGKRSSLWPFPSPVAPLLLSSRWYPINEPEAEAAN